MRLSSKMIVTTGLLAGVIGLGVWLGWFGNRAPSIVSHSGPEQDTEAAPARANSSRLFTKRSQARAAAQATNESPEEVAATSSDLMPDWQIKIDEVLRLDAEPSDVGRKLLEMLPRLPPESRMEALQHTVNLLDDGDYAPLGRLLSDPKTAQDELDILMSDVLNRPNAIKLPLLLEVARAPEHPKAGEAAEILELFLGEDRGENWSKWEEKVAEWLKEEAGLAASGNR